MHLDIDPSHPDHEAMDGHWIDFTTAGLAYARDVRAGMEQVKVMVSMLLVMPRLGGERPNVGWGGGYAVHWLIDPGEAGGLRLGSFFDMRENTYRIRRLDGSLTETQVDVLATLGVALHI